MKIKPFSKTFLTFIFICFSLAKAHGLDTKQKDPRNKSKWKKIAEKHLSKTDSSFCSKNIYKVNGPKLSPLMKKMIKDISPYIEKGTVGSFRFFSGSNFASRRVYRAGDEIFELTKGLIENAEHEVLVQTYLYQKDSLGVVKLREGMES